MPEPRRSRLRQLLERPGARRPLGRAVASLLGATVVSIGVIGALVVWHLIRRGRMIRERLGPPRDVCLPDLTDRVASSTPPAPHHASPEEPPS